MAYASHRLAHESVAARATNRKPATSVHPAAVAVPAVAASWLVLGAWLVFGGADTATVLAMVTVVLVMYGGRMLGGAFARNVMPDRETARSFRDFLKGRVDTATGRINGREALVEIAAMPVILALGGTVILAIAASFGFQPWLRAVRRCRAGAISAYMAARITGGSIMADKETRRRAVMGMGLIGAGLGAVAAAGTARADGGPARAVPEPQDAWLDTLGSRHRMVFDTTGAQGLHGALGYAGNFFSANQDGYGIAAAELGVVIVLRHMSTPLGYGDAVWAKYGPLFAQTMKLDALGIKDPHANPFNIAEKEKSGSGGVTLAALAQKGARFAVCATATKGIAATIARKSGETADAVHAMFTANLVAGGILVPAGIVALGRAQEHGYALASAGW